MLSHIAYILGSVKYCLIIFPGVVNAINGFIAHAPELTGETLSLATCTLKTDLL